MQNLSNTSSDGTGKQAQGCSKSSSNMPSSEITHLSFPLTLAWATAIHKVQGLTLDEIVDMKGGRFSPGQVYVAFSRVKTLQGLYDPNFNASAIKKTTK